MSGCAGLADELFRLFPAELALTRDFQDHRAVELLVLCLPDHPEGACAKLIRQLEMAKALPAVQRASFGLEGKALVANYAEAAATRGTGNLLQRVILH